MINRQNDWYSMTNEERVFVKSVESSSWHGLLSSDSETPESLGFIRATDNEWEVAEKFKELDLL